MIRKRIPIPNSLRTLRIGWLFWLWAFLLVLVGLLLYVLLPVTESAFYWAEGMLDSSSCSFIIAVCLDICSSGIECRGYRFSAGNAYGENYR